jgi:hypothetical protein
MQDNLLAQAAVFLWRLAKDFWEVYQLPLQWVYNDGNVPFAASAIYILLTLSAVSYVYLWLYLPSNFANRKQRRLTTAIDESFSAEQDLKKGLQHEFTNDYRLQYLNLLREISRKQDTICQQLASIRIQQGRNKSGD